MIYKKLTLRVVQQHKPFKAIVKHLCLLCIFCLEVQDVFLADQFQVKAPRLVDHDVCVGVRVAGQAFVYCAYFVQRHLGARHPRRSAVYETV